MKPCRECGEKVSSEAKTCPHCGVKWPANKLQEVASGLQGCGCILTLLITVPFLFLVCFAL